MQDFVFFFYILVWERERESLLHSEETVMTYNYQEYTGCGWWFDIMNVFHVICQWFSFLNFFHSLCMDGIICSNDCFSYVLSVIFSLCNSFNNLCIYGMEEFLYLSVRAIFTLNCSGFLIFECEVFSFLGNMVCNFSCLVVCRAKFSHKVILLSYNDCRLSFWRPWSYSSYSWFTILYYTIVQVGLGIYSPKLNWWTTLNTSNHSTT